MRGWLGRIEKVARLGDRGVIAPAPPTRVANMVGRNMVRRLNAVFSATVGANPGGVVIGYGPAAVCPRLTHGCLIVLCLGVEPPCDPGCHVIQQVRRNTNRVGSVDPAERELAQRTGGAVAPKFM